MGLLDDVRAATPDGPTDDADTDSDTDSADTRQARPQADVAASTPKAEQDDDHARTTTVPVAGEEVDLAPVETTQPDDEGTWLTGTDTYGRPRGQEALQQRQIVQTSAMQSIVNGVAGQIIGGELAFEGRDDVLEELSPAEEDAVDDLRSLMRDVLEGPHVPDLSLDQLIVSAVEDMMGPGQAVWQLREPANGDLPVAALQSLDPLTIRVNLDEHGDFREQPYWQAKSAFASGSVAQMGSIDPVPLNHDDIVVMDYPYGTRSYKTYPVSPAWQVREWLEILANSTTHHNRYYDDSEIPAGLIQVVNASDSTVDEIRDKIQQSASDPRDVPIVGGEGGAQWIEMGGTAINLDIIEEQKWFFQMCLGSLGLGKAEVGLIEDVNRANGEIEATRVYKRLGGPFIDQFASAMREVADLFPGYRELNRPFVPTIALSDPREERAKEERLRKQLEAGAITPRQYARRTGDTDLAEEDARWQDEVNGEVVNWGDKPVWVARRLFDAAGASDPEERPDDDAPDEEAV